MQQQLDACYWKTQNCFHMIVRQLIASAAHVQFHLRESLFTAVGTSTHAGVKKCIVFQTHKCVRQSFLEVKQTVFSVSSMQLIRVLEFNAGNTAGKSSTDTRRVSEKFHQQSASVEVSKPWVKELNQSIWLSNIKLLSMSWYICSCDWQVGSAWSLLTLHGGYFRSLVMCAVARMRGNRTARQSMMSNIFHILKFHIGLFGPLGDSSRAGFGPRAEVCAPLLYIEVLWIPGRVKRFNCWKRKYTSGTIGFTSWTGDVRSTVQMSSTSVTTAPCGPAFLLSRCRSEMDVGVRARRAARVVSSSIRCVQQGPISTTSLADVGLQRPGASTVWTHWPPTFVRR